MIPSLLICLAKAGCQTTPSIHPEPPRLLEIDEPIYLLPSNVDFSALEVAQVLASQTSKTLGSEPVATAQSIGPDGTTAPKLHASSRSALAEILKELPPNLPRAAVFLISSHGDVVEVVFVGARDQPNERLFAARLRSLRFTPATHYEEPVAGIVGIDLQVIGNQTN